ncbi:MAG: sugar phosphate isomerase/epimerase [Verrucomicrobia bacterium]|jgi:sugar phosphate isomerase/epimerase|nr:MAG: sugar phosphate isomerase/epimerase [Verrucomicrobiota bacterium]
MKILFTKANWERSERCVRDFVQLCLDSNYDGTEIYLPARTESMKEIREIHESAGLSIVSHIATEGTTVEDHLRSLERYYRQAVELQPLFVNSHTGKDYFSFADSLRIFTAGERLVAEHGIPLLHETHRGRALFSAPAAWAFLRELPSLRLTADFSHWVCVHESDLSDQPEAVEAALQAAQHIHARVGFHEGPQISDPRNPAHAPWLDLFTHWWQTIVDLRRAEQREWLTITPEFGPEPYMPLSGADLHPVGDAWEYNLWMRQHLRAHLLSQSYTPS